VRGTKAIQMDERDECVKLSGILLDASDSGGDRRASMSTSTEGKASFTDTICQLSPAFNSICSALITMDVVILSSVCKITRSMVYGDDHHCQYWTECLFPRYGQVFVDVLTQWGIADMSQRLNFLRVAMLTIKSSRATSTLRNPEQLLDSYLSSSYHHSALIACCHDYEVIALAQLISKGESLLTSAVIDAVEKAGGVVVGVFMCDFPPVGQLHLVSDTCTAIILPRALRDLSISFDDKPYRQLVLYKHGLLRPERLEQVRALVPWRRTGLLATSSFATSVPHFSSILQYHQQREAVIQAQIFYRTEIRGVDLRQHFLLCSVALGGTCSTQAALVPSLCDHFHGLK
jgi:hypothetical protein